MDSFEVYQMYIALKHHFTKSYDYFKYRGRVNVKLSTYSKRKDIYFFQKIAGKYRKQDVEDLFVSNLIHGDEWIGDLVGAECESHYLDWLGRMESFTYYFKEDLNNICSFLESNQIGFNDLFKKSESHEYPILYRFLQENMIQIETFLVFDEYLKVFDKFDKRIDETFIYPSHRDRLKKYKPFFFRKINKESLKPIFTDKIKEMYGITEN